MLGGAAEEDAAEQDGMSFGSGIATPPSWDPDKVLGVVGGGRKIENLTISRIEIIEIGPISSISEICCFRKSELSFLRSWIYQAFSKIEILEINPISSLSIRALGC